jgi:hypothetical protein
LQAADKLLQIEAVHGTRAAFYAAFVIVCLEARGQQSNFRMIMEMQLADLNNFTFFEYTKGDRQALTEFAEVLSCYQADCRRRFAHNSSANANTNTNMNTGTAAAV